MPKVKPHRSTPSLDMTPMVDLAFLLVTFFMLTTKFAPEEPVIVDMPKSHSPMILPDTSMMLITVSKDNKIFFNLDGKYYKQELLNNMGGAYGIKFTQDQVNRFSVLPSFGMPIKELPAYLDMDADARKNVAQSGIPCDTIQEKNELKDWIYFSRYANKRSVIAIKGDGDANYPVFNRIIETLKAQDVTLFELITNLESEPGVKTDTK
jgi:biopolymer transport protein ExbD